MTAKQGFNMYYTKGVAIGTEVSVRYRESGRLSGVVVKRGSTVSLYFLDDTNNHPVGISNLHMVVVENTL